MTKGNRLPALVVAALIGAVIAVAVGGTSFAGAVAGNPGAVWANRGHEPSGDGATIDAAAKTLGITADELRSDLRSGKTIAQIATEKNVPVNTVIDAMVAAAQSDLRDRITDFANNGGPGHGKGNGVENGKPSHAKGPPELAAAAAALGTSTDDLANAIHGGQTIAQVAHDKGVDVQKVIDAMTNEQFAHIDQDVKDGKITQSDGDARKAEITQHTTDAVNGVKGPFRPHGPH